MTIRHATETDLPTIVDIYNAAVPSRMATADLEPVSVESRMAWFKGRVPSQRPLWIIEVDDAIAGWLSFQSFYGRPAYHSTAEISIYISPNFQKRGLGKQLVEQAINESPNLGLKTLVSFIFAHNYPSLKLFEKFGFQHWGHLPKIADLAGVERDLIIMGLRVGEPE
ncbi:N-acetyltransferase [Anabaena cylindrica FACHB-243]|uniref:Phosphinothricin acetyltransferase n=1 Tax=Anabaena cylindrica (strain ATCC 27899 / PCC 7122) TaxID=272123 RepID=K9ZAT6_ANACC|nr:MULTISPECIES: GNAT family N-acetyltransferase [Anabaena]AFZ56286.1 Phosphinothricin acetyltransferase [Anabaena cylindrica PCC 7122]MBD2417517.1 N-acetyltransferase [Anabaena cylindrica FACHB-243]MBY5285156.1 N-acetyltransferase [Anabaena sp. CCAP 1446/1C]MBY5307388.1 N-acetyltransferase [Anabaena sp. CCAP 1446/1C]MCM2407687.1 GNAT family N-acetyltransferase [Anabaena sp. CCAP 1446/1C]